MRLIDKYILREWGKAFLLVLVGIMGVILLGLLYDDLMHFLEAGAGIGEILLFYSVLIPSFLPLIVPVALLISILFVLGSLHRNNEIVAMRAGGLSYWEVTRYLWGSGIVLMITLFILNAEWLPRMKEMAKGMEDGIRYEEGLKEVGEDGVGLWYGLAFDNGEAGRLWYINRFSDYNLKAYGVSVYERDGEGREVGRVLAREGRFEGGHWVFYGGREIEFDGEGEPVRSVAFDEKGYEGYDEDPELMVVMSKKPRHLSLLQLKKILEGLDYRANVGLAKYAVRYHGMMASPLVCLIVMGIAIPIAMGGVRTNPLVGVSKAIILFFLYYIVMSVCGVLGGQLVIEPWLAAWVPNVMMIALGVWLYVRMGK